MTETDKLLVRIGTARVAISRKTELTSLDYMIDGVLMNCSVLLEEQETDIGNLNETVKNLLNAYTEIKAIYGGGVRVVGELVRCKDCVKRGFDDCPVDGWMPNKADGDWYCADGERKEQHE